MVINKLKKKDYKEALTLVKEIIEHGTIQRNFNKFLGNNEFGLADIVTNIGLELAELIGEDHVQSKIDKLLLKTVEGLDKENLENMDLDSYVELVLEFVEVQGLKTFFKKAFPAINLEKLMELD